MRTEPEKIQDPDGRVWKSEAMKESGGRYDITKQARTGNGLV